MSVSADAVLFHVAWWCGVSVSDAVLCFMLPGGVVCLCLQTLCCFMLPGGVVCRCLTLCCVSCCLVVWCVCVCRRCVVFHVAWWCGVSVSDAVLCFMLPGGVECLRVFLRPCV